MQKPPESYEETRKRLHAAVLTVVCAAASACGPRINEAAYNTSIIRVLDYTYGPHGMGVEFQWVGSDGTTRGCDNPYDQRANTFYACAGADYGSPLALVGVGNCWDFATDQSVPCPGEARETRGGAS